MIFLNANILLEITLVGRPHYNQVKKFLQNTTDDTAISTLTANLVMHFGRKQQMEDAFLHAVLHENKILALTAEDYHWAINHEQGKDFEDALQIATAVRANCNAFITLDVKLAKRYAKLPIKMIIL